MGKENGKSGWMDKDTDLFLKYGHIFTPERESMMHSFLNLIPAEKNEHFTLVDIGVGGGWLTEAILMHFPKSRVIALDGSTQMTKYTQNRLRNFGDRLQFQSFDLLNPKWYSVFQKDVKCFVSSLVIHHLDGEGKRKLYKGLYNVLPPDGALLIADIIKETNERDRLHMARTWDEEVARRSLRFNGDLDAFHVFQEQRWNIFRYPDDPVDKPSTLFKQLTWLEEAGFKGVNTFWLKAGHALFGGYKSQ